MNSVPDSSDYPNIQIFPSDTVEQSEMSIAINPADQSMLLVGANTITGADTPRVFNQGTYYTGTEVTDWGGNDDSPITVLAGSDPAVAFDGQGNAYFNYLHVDGVDWEDPRKVTIAQSPDGGRNWTRFWNVPNQGARPDKNHLAVDKSVDGRIYTAWTSIVNGNVFFSRYDTLTDNFTNPSNLSAGLSYALHQGVNLAVGPPVDEDNGTLYVVWAVYLVSPADSGREKYLGFCKSVNSGASFSTPITLPGLNVEGIRGPLKDPEYPIKVNSYPSMAVDLSGGDYHGRIYVVWADLRIGNPDIFITHSHDGGDEWMPPIKINDDLGTTDQWFPWVTVDPNGYVHVVFYDSRDDPVNNSMTAVYMVSSYNGGLGFMPNERISDYRFTPCPIPRAVVDTFWLGGYMGDYIGITSTDGLAYPCWNDNRTGVQQAYMAVVETYSPGGSGPPGCPYVYTWDGSEYRQDNTILTQSERPGVTGPVTDYYRLQQPLVAQDGEYKLLIREFERERSYLDAFQLIAVDHPSESRVGVSPRGEIFLFEEDNVPVACLDHTGKDLLDLVSAQDGRLYSCDGPGTMDIYFDVLRHSWPGALADPIPDPWIGMQAGPPPFPKKGNPGAAVTVEVEDAYGRWHRVDTLPARGNAEDALWLLNPEEGYTTGDRFRIRLRWNEGFVADQITYHRVSSTLPTTTALMPWSAARSSGGDATAEVAAADGRFVTLSPGDWLELAFPESEYPPLPDGWTRSFVLKSTGYYETIADAAPRGYVLLQNYPNPFNAGTSISYIVRKPGRVNLTIYNVLGQQVAAIVDRDEGPGTYSVPWDGLDEKGRTMPSGVYLYRLELEGEVDTKKMILMR